jgi:hypothetical protein
MSKVPYYPPQILDHQLCRLVQLAYFVIPTDRYRFTEIPVCDALIRSYCLLKGMGDAAGDEEAD